MTLRHQLLPPAVVAGLALIAFSPQAQADASGAAVQTGGADAGAPAAAEAQPQRESQMPRLTVVGLALDPASEKITAQLVRRAQNVASDSSRFIVAATNALLDPEGAQATADNLRKARDLIASAKSNYDELELEVSRGAAEQAIAILKETDLSGESFDLYVSARKILIAALLADSDGNAADVQLRDLLPQDLNSSFDPNVFPPDYIAQVNRIRKELKSTAAGSLDLKVTPAADVYVDGIYRGVSPVELRELPKGDHVLTLVAPGHKVLQKIFSTGAADTMSEKLTPVKKGFVYAPFLKALKGKFSSEARAKPAQDLAKFLGVEQMAIVAIKSTALHRYEATLVRLDAADGHEYANAEFTLNGDGTAALDSADGVLNSMFSMDLPRGKGGEAVQARVNAFRWKERHTGFLLYGVAAAALGSGITFGIDARNQADTYKSLTAPQNSPVYDRVETVGKRSALIADISYGVAIAAAVSATILVIHDLVSNSAPSAMDAGREPIGGRDEPKAKAQKKPMAEDDVASSWSEAPIDVSDSPDGADAKPADAGKGDGGGQGHEKSTPSTDGWGEDW